jgi:transposase
MFWIEGIVRNPGGFNLETILPQAIREKLPLQFLRQPIKLKLTKKFRERITSDCVQWVRTDARPFLECLGIEASAPKDGQAVFRLVEGDRQYLIPASVFIAGMMKPIQHIQKFLFKPQGLESFCTPLLEDGTPKVGIHLPCRAVFGRATTFAGLAPTYSWIHCFPSANAMWASVYQAACDGRLDVALPNARITMRVHGVKSDNFHLVTEMSITKLEALEQPFEFATNHTRHIVMHESAGLDWQTLNHPKNTLPAREKEWRLSESEWQAISLLLLRRGSAKYDLREIVDLILVKFGTGCPWRKLEFGNLNFSIVQNTYHTLQKNGNWQKIEKTLTESRAGGDASRPT